MVVARLLFGAAILSGLLPAAPLIKSVNTLVGIPIQGPLIAVWLAVVALASRRPASGLPLAMSLATIGALSLGGAGGASARVWVGALLIPLAVFVGLQLVDEARLRAARTAVRFSLLVAVTLQVLYVVAAAGAEILSPTFIFARHTDVVFWAEAGSRVLGNPNNASVVFCAAFGWAVAERVLGQKGWLSLPFLVLSALSVWVTGSRGAILTAGLVVVLALLLRQGGTRSRPFLVLGLAGGALLVFESWYRALTPYLAGSSESVSARFGTRGAAVEQILTSSPFGSGAGTADKSLRIALGGVLRGDYAGATAHDPFLNWGVSLGLLGLLLLLGAWLVAVQRGLRGSGALALLPLFGYLAAAESAGIDWLNETNPAWSILMWALLGLAWRGGIFEPQTRDQAPTEADQRVTA